MQKLLGMTLAAATILSTAAIAAPERIRGTVAAVGADSVTVHTASSDVTVAITGDTKYLKTVKSSLDKVDKDSFIGTATKEVGGKMIALEVVIFPAAMKGAGEGHYAWDRIPDTTVSGGSTSSSMTNGTVSAVQTGATANSSMTNGTVTAASGSGGTRQITVDYKGGQQHIIVPPTAPIVTFEPDTKADVASGKVVFVIANNDGGKLTAAAVIIGTDGAPPPM